MHLAKTNWALVLLSVQKWELNKCFLDILEPFLALPCHIGQLLVFYAYMAATFGKNRPAKLAMRTSVLCIVSN